MLAKLLHRAKRQPVFMVNQGEAVRVNLRTAVNAADIRMVNEDGREYMVIPSYTLPDGVVMNGGLYTKEEIDKSYATLENTPAPVGHPMADGQYISAYHPKAINAYYAGAFNRNVKREGHRVAVEKWVDVEFAQNSVAGRKLLEAVANKQPVHTSTGILLDQEHVTNSDQTGYKWIARNMRFDHDAILINETGAATPEQGVGLFVNVSEAVSVLSARSYGATQDLLRQALTERFGQGDTWVYVDDFDATSVVYCAGDDYFRLGYSLVGDKVELSGTPEAVERKTTFTLKSTVNKILNLLRGHVLSEPETNTEASEMTLEEMQAALDAQSEKQTAALNAALEPLKTELATVTAANAALSAQLQANTKAAEAEKRAAVAAEAEKRAAVAAEHGEVVANALTGEALDTMFAKCAKCAKSAPLLGGLPTNNKSEGDANSRLID